MMRASIIAIVMLSGPAFGADKALILNDQEQAALRGALDSAVRANGLSPVSRDAFTLSDKLDAAGVVTERKDNPDPKPTKEGAQ